jgi:hypothetical protein
LQIADSYYHVFFFLKETFHYTNKPSRPHYFLDKLRHQPHNRLGIDSKLFFKIKEKLPQLALYNRCQMYHEIKEFEIIGQFRKQKGHPMLRCYINSDPNFDMPESEKDDISILQKFVILPLSDLVLCYYVISCLWLVLCL